jgi:hypothetical protein
MHLLLVNQRMRKYYQAYCGIVPNPSDVMIDPDAPATKYFTLYSAAFSSFACAEYWARQGNKMELYSIDLCSIIAKTGIFKL